MSVSVISDLSLTDQKTIQTNVDSP